METRKTGYLDYLITVVENDLKALREAEKSYGDSWKRRGGVGAYMMLARKWDRIENQVKQNLPNCEHHARWNIFEHLAHSKPNGIADDVRDLRRYLILVEAEMRARG